MADANPQGGSYEVLRARLLAEARALEEKAGRVNDRRKAIFGGTELALVANERVRTENACVPRDMISVAGHLLFGFEVFLGLREETRVADVLATYKFARSGDAFDLSQVPFDGALGFLANAEFTREIADLFRYTKGARLTQLRRTETRLLVAMQIGATPRDVKVLRFAIDARDGVAYVDARGDEDYAPPKPHDFSWKLAGRDAHVAGKFPHVNVLDEVFVDTIGGDLTVKVENNTKEGQGIYREPVDDANQTLDDAEVWYAKTGALVLLRVKPFRELAYRHLVVDVKRRRVTRVDALGQACLSLPEGHGIVFPGGLYLDGGDFKLFDGDDVGMTFERVIKSPNGEDVAYVFYRDTDGQYSILHYNLIRREAESPLRCNGYSLFADGTMTVFRASSEPTRTHPIQVWRTPFTSADFAAQAKTDGSYLAKVGNAELVRGVSDALSLARLAARPDPTRQTYDELVRAAARLLDGAYWLGHAEADDLAGTVRALGKAVEAVLDEFEKVEAIRARARAEVDAARQRLLALEQQDPGGLSSIDAFLVALTERRRLLGDVLSLRELREVDSAAVDALEAGARAAFDLVSGACVTFLLGRDAFAELCARLDRAVTEMEAVTKASELASYAKDLDTVSAGLSLLAEVISGLKVDDTTQRTRILESVSAAFSQQNRARATLAARKKELGRREGEAELAVQLSLLSQSVSAALAVSDTPERTQEELSKLLLTIEEIEGRFGELDDVLATLADRRQEVQDAFGARRQALLDERQRRAAALSKAATRVLAGIVSRARTLGSPEELNAYFASDPTVMRVNDLCAELRTLGDTVRAEDLATQLAAAKQDARRKLRDDRDLGGEEGTVRFGAHAFRVTKEPLDLVLVPRDDALAVHLTGTDYFEAVSDELLEASRDLWGDTLVSESADVYRAEYLAVSIFTAAERGEDGLSLARLREDAIEPARLLATVRARAEARVDEGYERGVHDADAARILERVLHLAGTVGLLRYSPDARAAAVLHWSELDAAARLTLRRRARAATRLADELADPTNLRELIVELGAALHADGRVGLSPASSRSAAAYLAAQIAREQVGFTTTPDATRLHAAVLAELEALGGRRELALDLPTLPRATALRLCYDHVTAYVKKRGGEGAAYAWEAAVLWLTEGEVDRYASSTQTRAEVTGLLGRHPRVRDRAMTVALDELLPRVDAHATERAPRFVALRRHKLEVAARERAKLHLSELVPRVLTSFVRNRLVDEVLLPLVGKNLAKQIGDASSDARTDRMGMLLLVSPPGYGKTTLMEYVAEKLGLVFVKVNGPALGHSVTSLDPADAKSATARQEVDKINLALEMGQNVMLYLDDIQHTSAELLQKFISLCDGQRRIEGVWRGTTRTYDLRGKRFCVVMAGNPYTESGELFRIPDMLANRADTYNLGDVLGGQRELFALSYLENSLTANPTLSPLAARDPKDLHQLVRMARGEAVEADALSQGYSSVELTEMSAVVARLMKVQALLLRVNQAYVESASKDDAYRTEPAFKLQGSYRNMAKIAARVVAAMNDEELEQLLDDHYKSEAQTLTTSAEQNLLLLGELRGRLSPEGAARLAGIRDEYQRKKRMGGAGDDPVARVTGTLSSLELQLKAIRDSIAAGVGARSEVDWQALSRELSESLRTLASPRLDVSLDASAPQRLGDALAEHAAVLRELLAKVGAGGGADALDARLGDVTASLARLETRLRASTGAPPSFEVALTADGDHNFYCGVDGDDPLTDGGLFVATYERAPALGAMVLVRLTFPGGAVHAAEGYVSFRQDLVDDDGATLIPGFGVRLTEYQPALSRAVAEFATAREPMLRDA